MIQPGQTLISQYFNSHIIHYLVGDWNADIDPRFLLTNFYNDVWNLDTAGMNIFGTDPLAGPESYVSYGLDMWGRRVGVTRVVNVPAPTAELFGFEHWEPFGQAPFYTGQPLNANVTLNNTDFQTLIMAKALSNISGCSIPAINQILYKLYTAPGRPYEGGQFAVQDLGDMHIVYVFNFALSETDLAILVHSGVAQRPTGVSATILMSNYGNSFGFDTGDRTGELGLNFEPFGLGTFQSYSEYPIVS